MHLTLATAQDQFLPVMGLGLWLLAVAAIFLAAGLGFASGLAFARWRERTLFQRARQSVTRLFDTAQRSLINAEEVCQLLEQRSKLTFFPEAAAQLESHGHSLFESISRIVCRHCPEESASPATEPMVTLTPASPPTGPVKLEWQTASLAPLTGLPDQASYQMNLDLLLAHSRRTRTSHGMLAIQIDKLSALRSRLGAAITDSLVKKLSLLVCRAVRDQDLVCQTSADQIVVLQPDLDLETGTRLARGVRDAVREHHFRVDEQGSEVLVTASFGFIAAQPEDHAETLHDRAVAALRKSQRLGRNQLHVHTGETVLHLSAV